MGALYSVAIIPVLICLGWSQFSSHEAAPHREEAAAVQVESKPPSRFLQAPALGTGGPLPEARHPLLLQWYGAGSSF
jgi:hypothetical protein